MVPIKCGLNGFHAVFLRFRSTWRAGALQLTALTALTAHTVALQQVECSAVSLHGKHSCCDGQTELLLSLFPPTTSLLDSRPFLPHRSLNIEPFASLFIHTMVSLLSRRLLPSFLPSLASLCFSVMSKCLISAELD